MSNLRKLMSSLPPDAVEIFETMFNAAADDADTKWGEDPEFRSLMELTCSLFFILGFRAGAREGSIETVH